MKSVSERFVEFVKSKGGESKNPEMDAIFHRILRDVEDAAEALTDENVIYLNDEAMGEAIEQKHNEIADKHFAQAVEQVKIDFPEMSEFLVYKHAVAFLDSVIEAGFELHMMRLITRDFSDDPVQ